MPHPSRLAAASAIAIASAGPAAAELTAAGVWEDLRAYGQAYAMEVGAGAETPTASGLRVEDVTMSAASASAEGSGSFVARIPFIEFTENADGSVAVSVAEISTIEMEFETEDGVGAMAFELAQPGLEIETREAQGGIAYDFSGPEIAMRTTEVTDGGAPVDMTLDMVVRDMRGAYLSIGETVRELDQDLTAGEMTLDLSVSDPDEGGGDLDMTVTLSELTSASTSTIPEGADLANLSGAVRDGFATDVEFAYARSAYELEIAEASGTTVMSGSASGGGGVSVTIGDGGLGYSVAEAGSRFTISGDGIPVPQVTASIARTGFDLLMPIVASQAAAPFRIAMRLEEIGLDDQIWGMFDPAGALDRAPWTLALDLTGAARLDVDLLDPEATAAMDGETPPGQLESLSVDALRLSVLGADLSGTGAATFDNADTQTFGGMPAPDGSLTLSLTGATALFEQLATLGLVPEDQLMMGQMMLGLFARQTGEDAYETVLEVRPDGSLFANGQQIQ